MARKRFPRLLKIVSSAVSGADEDMPLEGRLERLLHFCVMVVRQFIRHRCLVRASALSYSTLLALIPLLVVALNVASSLLGAQNEAKLTQFVEQTVARIAPQANIPAYVASTNSSAQGGHYTAAGVPFGAATNMGGAVGGTNGMGLTTVSNAPAAPATASTLNTQNAVAQTIHDLVRKASSGTLGVTGGIFLIFTAISLLRGIEETFNDIWGVTRSRNWLLQILLYWTIISLGPLVLSTGLGLTGTLHMQKVRVFLESSPFLSPVLKHLLPIALLSLMLGCFYKLTPNTKVEFGAAMVGGACAGTAWHVYNQLGFLLAARAMSASRFYGSVFLIVLLMGGLYVLWLILLFGTEIAYAYQNRAAYLQDRLADNVNQRGREFVALRIMTCLGRRFKNGLRPATVPEISSELGVPSRLTQSVLRTLAGTRLVTEVAGTEAAFCPARPLEAINAHDILVAMRTGTGQELPLADLPELAEIYGEFARIERAERDAAAGISLLTLANRPAPQSVVPPSSDIKYLAGSAAEPTPKATEPEPVEEAKATPFPEEVLPPEPPAAPEPTVQPGPPSTPTPPRRETVRPDEHMDFPL